MGCRRMFLDFDAGFSGGAGIAGFYERGLACAPGADAMDLVEAHKWFNLAAMSGDARGVHARADMAFDMTPREIAEAQRRARTFMRG